MEHVTIERIGDNVKLTPGNGYKIADYNGDVYGVVVCREADINKFHVIEVN